LTAGLTSLRQGSWWQGRASFQLAVFLDASWKLALPGVLNHGKALAKLYRFTPLHMINCTPVRKTLSIFALTVALLPLTNFAVAATEAALPAGSAHGSLTYEEATAELKFAAAFVDQKEDGKPIILLLSDMKLPTEKWTSEFDMMRDSTKWSGVVFFLRAGSVYRTDIHKKGRQASVSGFFDLKLDKPTSKDLTGTAKTKEDEKETKLDVTFHATVK
jgi:hypothetical protein